MNKETVLFKNPAVQVFPLDENYVALYNPFHGNGIKVINRAQFDIFNKVVNQKSIHEIAEETGTSVDQFIQVCKLLQQKKFINSEYRFTNISDQYPDKPNKIDFWVHITEDCTLRCRYCYINKDEKRTMASKVLFDFGKKLLNTIDKRDLNYVSLRFSGGEPLLKLNFIKEFITFIKPEFNRRGIKYDIGFLTNLTLLKDEMVSYFIKEDLYTSISLDGLQDYHDASRYFPDGSGSFETIIQHIDKLISHGHKRMMIMTVVSNDNIEGLPDLSRFLIKKRLPFRFSFVNGEKLDYNKLIPSLEKTLKIFEKAINEGYPFSQYYKLNDLKFLNPSYSVCSAGVSSGGLYTDGQINFCQKELGQPEYLGSIYDQDDLIEIIQKGMNKIPRVSEECNQCEYRYICGGGCPLERIKGKAPECELYKNFIPKIINLMAKERYYRIKSGIMKKSI